MDEIILPNKYVTLSQSFLGIGAMVLDIIGSKKMTIENIWTEFEKRYGSKSKKSHYPSYQKFLLTLDFIYLTGMITYNEQGEIFNENIRT